MYTNAQIFRCVALPQKLTLNMWTICEWVSSVVYKNLFCCCWYSLMTFPNALLKFHETSVFSVYILFEIISSCSKISTTLMWGWERVDMKPLFKLPAVSIKAMCVRCISCELSLTLPVPKGMLHVHILLTRNIFHFLIVALVQWKWVHRTNSTGL